MRQHQCVPCAPGRRQGRGPCTAPPSLPTSQPASQPTHLPIHMPTQLPAYLPTHIPTQLPAYLLTHIPSTLNPPPSTLHPPPSTLNPPPSTLNPQPLTLRNLTIKGYLWIYGGEWHVESCSLHNTNDAVAPAPLYEKGIKFIYVCNGIYYTACFLQVILKNLCSRLAR